MKQRKTQVEIIAPRYRLQEHDTRYNSPPKVEALKVTGYFFEGSNVPWETVSRTDMHRIQSRNRNSSNFAVRLYGEERMIDVDFSISKINHPAPRSPTCEAIAIPFVPRHRELITCQFLSVARGAPSISAAITGKLARKSARLEISAGRLRLSFKSVFGLNGRPRSRVRDAAQATSCFMPRPFAFMIYLPPSPHDSSIVVL